MIKGHLREFAEIKMDNKNSFIMAFFDFNIEDLYNILSKIK